MEEIRRIGNTGERKISSGMEKQDGFPETLHDEMLETRSNGLRNTVQFIL